MQPVQDKIKVICGKKNLEIDRSPMQPFDELICDFLNSLSVRLMADRNSRNFPDVITFAYWCRKSNIYKLKKQFEEDFIRLGLGYIFHIAPSNIPINFAFSYVFSLLAGNANIVRIPSKHFPQNEIVFEALSEILGEDSYQKIAERSVFIQYEHDNEITGFFSETCNGRIIWGGDETIRTIKKIPVPVRSVEISFADRYSFCVIDSKSILNTTHKDLKKLARDFYNDTYLMDQNACSSPHLLVWLGSEEEASLAKAKFWSEIFELTSHEYGLKEVNAIDKYTAFCRDSIQMHEIKEFSNTGNQIYRLALDDIPIDIDKRRGNFGYFYEYSTQDISNVSHIINNRYQTLTYYGVETQALIDFVIKNSLSGIDRIVPIGSALDINIIWDGYDLIRTLSRICDIR